MKPVKYAYLFLSALFLASGCAFMNKRNTPLFNAVERNFWPSKKGLQVAVAPVVFPIGVVALVTDGLIIRPATVIDDSYREAIDIWKGADWDKEYVTNCATAPLKSVLTPVVFFESFALRSFFDIPEKGEAKKPKTPEIIKEKKIDIATSTAEAIRNGNRAELLSLLKSENDFSEKSHYIYGAMGFLFEEKDPCKRLGIFRELSNIFRRGCYRDKLMFLSLGDPSLIIRFEGIKMALQEKNHLAPEVVARLRIIVKEGKDPIIKKYAEGLVNEYGPQQKQP